jgi:L-ascorbate metabolism protein UlaG (beta-lactamase superfamily)
LPGDGDQDVIERLTGLDIDYGEAAAEIRLGELFIEAFHIPHSGWPDRQPVVQNLAFRVTVDGTTVLHLGDADTRDEHFVLDAARWQQRDIDAAFPPYWFFSSAAGRAILEQRLRPALAIGIHVPVDVDPQYADGIEGYALFRRPGERRSIDADE